MKRVPGLRVQVSSATALTTDDKPLTTDYSPVSFTVIDTHTHLDILFRHHPERIEWMKENRYIPISWSYSGRAATVKALTEYFQRHASLISDLNAQGLVCYYLVGVHPRCITPDLRPHHIPELLLPYLEDRFCLGIGEIGLETGAPLEADILSAQLALHTDVADGLRKFGVHTPRGSKKPVTDQILSLLSGIPGIESLAVIDHCNLNTLPSVLSKGFHAGITLSPAKVSHEEMVLVIEHQSTNLDGIMCNTDSGRNLFSDLYDFASSPRFGTEERRMLSGRTAAEFFGIPLHPDRNRNI